MPMRGPFRRVKDGKIAVALRTHERAMLATLPLQLKELLETDDPSLRRLFPVAYHQNPEQEAEFQRLMREDLVAKRVATAELLAASAETKALEPDDVNLWLSALNDLRLVLGTQLDVSEEHDLDLGDLDDVENPAVVQYHVYSWLGYLQDTLLRVTDDPEPDVDAFDGLDLEHPDLAELSEFEWEESDDVASNPIADLDGEDRGDVGEQDPSAP